MRYKETGNVHMDFYRTLNATISYLRRKYGMELLDKTFRRTATDVYRSIREDLLKGNPQQLIRHWEYFLKREGGEYTIKKLGDAVIMTVNRCPAVDYLTRKGIKIDTAFCRQTVVINLALAEGTPFEINTQVIGSGRCIQTIRRRKS